MLVEDDNNLREIYGARLLAEGYEIVSAKDGEEALAMAVKEKPDLIISDIMMPKISGFDMLDILRSTAETKNTKVIMMTALSQSEDKDRANKLGADRYLVKSQVTLEDVAKAAQEVLSGTDSGTTPVEPAPVTPETNVPTATTPPVASPTPTATPTPADPVATPASSVPTPVADDGTTTPDPAPASSIPTPVADDGSATTPTTAPVADASTTTPVNPVVNPVTDTGDNKQILENAMATVAGVDSRTNTITPGDHPSTSVHTKVIEPINDLSNQQSNLQQLVAEEEAKTKAAQAGPAIVAPVAPATSSTPAPSPVITDITPQPPQQ